MVLTQLKEEFEDQAEEISFHTTMVLTQLAAAVRFVADNQFPYHYGSHATGHYDYLQEMFVRFPYHYGSHATEMMREREGGWF